jgi:hypothetical protein
MPPAVESFSDRLRGLGWVSDLWVGGSLATGDYRPGVSDVDLVAIVAEELDESRLRQIREVHGDFDDNLGCVYADVRVLADPAIPHPTWTHGELIHRPLSRLARAELRLAGFPLFGLEPSALLDPTDVRRAVHDELRGPWLRAVGAPSSWLSPEFAELSLVTMARARHALRTGELITKTEAIRSTAFSQKLARRRRGEPVPLPRVRIGVRAWTDACLTIARVKR